MPENEDAVTEEADQVAEHLYGLEPEQFVAARDEAAKQLRANGDAAAAKTVKSLRRPTVAAWAVNRLVRVHPDEVDELLDVTRALDGAQRDALAGRKGDVRSVSERRQRVIDDLVSRTEAIIEAAGRSSSAHRDEIVRTLQASTDPDLAQQLRDGRLVTALEPISALTGLATWFEESGAMSSASDRTRRQNFEQASDAAEDELTKAERAVTDAVAEVDRLQAELRAAKARVDRATRQREKRRAALDDARRALDDDGT